jgi:hypothetical protein
VDQNTFNVVLTVAAVVITLSFVTQAVMFVYINQSMRKLNRVAVTLQTKVEPVIDQVQTTVTTVRGAAEKISTEAKEVFDNLALESRAIAAAISTSTREIADVARHQAEQFSCTLEESNLMLQRQVGDLDRLLTRTQVRIEDTTIEVQTSVVKPLRELAAVVTGVRRTVDVLLNRSRKQVNQAYQDEEMFI